MDLSLDEIIQRKRIVAPMSRKGPIGNNSKSAIKIIGRSAGGRTFDARNKIIQRNRAKIRDAREKLAQITRANGDARFKLQRRRNIPSRGINPARFRTPKSTIRPNLKASSSMPQLIQIPRGYVDYDNMEMMEEDYQPQPPANVNLRRTVHNDVIPSFGPYKSLERRTEDPWNIDLFDIYETPMNRGPETPEDLNLRRQIRNISPDILPPKGILRQNREPSPSYSRRYKPEQPSHLSYEMRSRLEHAPDPHMSVGIFSNPLKVSHMLSTSLYRIVVSNLHSSVTQSDIKELFEDIGELQEARLVRPGVAEVIFKNLKDAEKAVDTYHNRQLDGQPMKCLLVNPRSSNKPTAPAIKGNNASRSSDKTPLEIDIDALHKVLFRRH